jgi:hypothetical protein
MSTPQQALSDANRARPLSEVTGFMKRGADIGVYNASQVTNMGQALKLALEQARGLGVDTEKLTVGEAAARLEEWLQEYGRNSKAGAQSIATYNGRGKKLFDDFIKWNNGDHMAWKKTIVKSPKPAKKAKPKESEAPPPPANGTNAASSLDAGPNEHMHVLRLPGGAVGKLVLPQPISLKVINAAWKLLDAYKIMLVAQAEIDEGSEDDDEEGDEGDT